MTSDDPALADLGRPPLDSQGLERVGALIDAWLTDELRDNPVLVAVDRDTSEHPRWFARVTGDEKDTFTIWFTLRQRMLHYETYVMPAPDENHEAFYAQLLRRNQTFVGAAFTIGDEDAIFLRGAIPVDTVTRDELDRILGSLYVYVEQSFRAALRVGFATRFRT